MNEYDVALLFMPSSEAVIRDVGKTIILPDGYEAFRSRITEYSSEGDSCWQLESALDQAESVSMHIKDIIKAFPETNRLTIPRDIDVRLNIGVFWNTKNYATSGLLVHSDDFLALQQIIPRYVIMITTYPCRD